MTQIEKTRETPSLFCSLCVNQLNISVNQFNLHQLCISSPSLPLNRHGHHRLESRWETHRDLARADVLDWRGFDEAWIYFVTLFLERGRDFFGSDGGVERAFVGFGNNDDFKPVDRFGEFALLFFVVLHLCLVRRLPLGNRMQRLLTRFYGEVLGEKKISGVSFGDVGDGAFGSKCADVAKEDDLHKRSAFLMIPIISR